MDKDDNLGRHFPDPTEQLLRLLNMKLTSTLNEVSERAKALIEDNFVADILMPGCPFDGLFKSNGEYLLRVLDGYRANGVDWVSVTVGLDHFPSIEKTTQIIASYRNIFNPNINPMTAERFALIRSVEEMEAAKATGKLAVNFNFQGSMPLLGNLDMVELYYSLGVGQMLLAYNDKNLVGDGCHERTDCGLSKFGLNLVAKMNQVGMIVDLTHTGERTTLEASEASTEPVIYSHSNPLALNEHGRNISDAQIKACAATGGVIGVNGVGAYMSKAGDNVSADIIIKQIDYIAELVGAEHVGFGLDYVDNIDYLNEIISEHPTKFPADQGYHDVKFAGPDAIPHIVEGLLAKNYSDEQVKGILGENFLRVCRQVWR